MMIPATARTIRPDGFTAASAGRRSGFSLTELLIAIGVLGIGLGMVAALFVTGLTQVRISLGDSEGGMVAANGIAVARMFVRTGHDVASGTASSGGAYTLTDDMKSWVDGDLDGYHVCIINGTGAGQTRLINANTTIMLTVTTEWGTPPDTDSEYVVTSGVPSDSLTVIADGNDTTVINAAFQKYPYNDATTNKGFVILARQTGAEACQVVSVAYAKTAGGAVTGETIIGSTVTANGVTTLTVTVGVSNLSVGSLVIVADTGEYATIVTLSGSTATLDHELTMGSGATAYTIVEAGAGSPPSTGVCVTKTGLKP